MAVLEDRPRQPASRTVLCRVVAVKPFHYAPAVVAASCGQVDLLPFILPTIREPKNLGLPIERKTPRVANPVGEDFRTAS